MRRTLIALVLLLLVAVTLDFGARIAAQTALADEIQRSGSLPERPGVTITGFPFLTQVISGRYRTVGVTVHDLASGDGVRVDDVRATFTGVHLPLSELFGSRTGSVPVDHADASGTIAFSSLDRAAATVLPAGSLTVRFKDGGGGLLGVDGRYLAGGAPIAFTATARVMVSGNRIALAVVRSSLASVPEPARSEVAGLLGTSLDLQQLPLRLKPTSASVGPGGVTLRATGSHLVLPAG